LPSSLDSSSSLRIASWMWRGTMLRRRQGASARAQGQRAQAARTGSSCCRGWRCRPAPAPQRPGTPARRPGTPARRRPHGWRTCRPSGSGRHGPPGTGGPPWRSGSQPSWRSFPCRGQTLLREVGGWEEEEGSGDGARGAAREPEGVLSRR
jgi:hypothetical protein